MIVALLASLVGAIASDLPACPSSGYFHNCFGTWTFENGQKYVGEFKHNKRHGQGTFTKVNGDKYMGDFKDGVPDGQGIFVLVDGGKHEGEWRDGKRHGPGTHTFETYGIVSVITGMYEDGKLIGPLEAGTEDHSNDFEIISASSGSGFAVSADGYVITNHHVIDGCEKELI